LQQVVPEGIRITTKAHKQNINPAPTLERLAHGQLFETMFPRKLNFDPVFAFSKQEGSLDIKLI